MTQEEKLAHHVAEIIQLMGWRGLMFEDPDGKIIGIGMGTEEALEKYVADESVLYGE